MDFKRFYQITIPVLLFICITAIAEPSLTIYNRDFAVVREQLNLNLQKGSNKVSVTDITALLEPDSVILRDPNGKQALQIIEQNFRADPVSQGLLLSLNEGKEIEFITKDRDNAGKIVKGKIIRSGYVPQHIFSSISSRRYVSSADAQPVIEVDGKLRFSLPGEPVFPTLADDTILKPTLSWILNTDANGPLNAELSYITDGMGWKADYSIIAQGNSDKVDVIGWITVDNQSGRTFENAKIKLMAGDVNKIQQNLSTSSYISSEAYTPPWSGEVVSEKAFEDFHLYNLNRQTTLHDRETKQVEFLSAEDVNSQSMYIYDGAVIESQYRGYSPENIKNEKNYGTKCNPKVWIFRELNNSKEEKLGFPLPKGTMRFYKRNDDGQLEFTGENVIDHTSVDEVVRVYTGNAFDLIGERTRTAFNIDVSRDRWVEESFRIKLRNHKEKEAVEIKVVEHLYRGMGWEIVEKSDTFKKTDSQTIEFRVKLEPGEDKVITYKVFYTS